MLENLTLDPVPEQGNWLELHRVVVWKKISERISSLENEKVEEKLVDAAQGLKRTNEALNLTLNLVKRAQDAQRNSTPVPSAPSNKTFSIFPPKSSSRSSSSSTKEKPPSVSQPEKFIKKLFSGPFTGKSKSGSSSSSSSNRAADGRSAEAYILIPSTNYNDGELPSSLASSAFDGKTNPPGVTLFDDSSNASAKFSRISLMSGDLPPSDAAPTRPIGSSSVSAGGSEPMSLAWLVADANRLTQLLAAQRTAVESLTEQVTELRDLRRREEAAAMSAFSHSKAGAPPPTELISDPMEQQLTRRIKDLDPLIAHLAKSKSRFTTAERRLDNGLQNLSQARQILRGSLGSFLVGSPSAMLGSPSSPSPSPSLRFAMKKMVLTPAASQSLPLGDQTASSSSFPTSSPSLTPSLRKEGTEGGGGGGASSPLRAPSLAAVDRDASYPNIYPNASEGSQAVDGPSKQGPTTIGSIGSPGSTGLSHGGRSLTSEFDGALGDLSSATAVYSTATKESAEGLLPTASGGLGLNAPQPFPHGASSLPPPFMTNPLAMSPTAGPIPPAAVGRRGLLSDEDAVATGGASFRNPGKMNDMDRDLPLIRFEDDDEAGRDSDALLGSRESLIGRSKGGKPSSAAFSSRRVGKIQAREIADKIATSAIDTAISFISSGPVEGNGIGGLIGSGNIGSSAGRSVNTTTTNNNNSYNSNNNKALTSAFATYNVGAGPFRNPPRNDSTGLAGAGHNHSNGCSRSSDYGNMLVGTENHLAALAAASAVLEKTVPFVQCAVDDVLEAKALCNGPDELPDLDPIQISQFATEFSALCLGSSRGIFLAGSSSGVGVGGGGTGLSKAVTAAASGSVKGESNGSGNSVDRPGHGVVGAGKDKIGGGGGGVAGGSCGVGVGDTVASEEKGDFVSLNPLADFRVPNDAASSSSSPLQPGASSFHPQPTVLGGGVTSGEGGGASKASSSAAAPPTGAIAIPPSARTSVPFPSSPTSPSLSPPLSPSPSRPSSPPPSSQAAVHLLLNDLEDMFSAVEASLRWIRTSLQVHVLPSLRLSEEELVDVEKRRKANRRVVLARVASELGGAVSPQSVALDLVDLRDSFSADVSSTSAVLSTRGRGHRHHDNHRHQDNHRHRVNHDATVAASHRNAEVLASVGVSPADSRSGNISNNSNNNNNNNDKMVSGNNSTTGNDVGIYSTTNTSSNYGSITTAVTTTKKIAAATLRCDGRQPVASSNNKHEQQQSSNGPTQPPGTSSGVATDDHLDKRPQSRSGFQRPSAASSAFWGGRGNDESDGDSDETEENSDEDSEGGVSGDIGGTVGLGKPKGRANSFSSVTSNVSDVSLCSGGDEVV